tara:strand:- start:5151 stop:5684 length:534 start_codon:yes stop_codon:yes gene_type:complete
MQLKETREALNRFGKFVIQQARSRLTKGVKRGGKRFSQNDTKKLYNSLEYLPFNRSGSIGVEFYMEDYGKFQDKGVKGTKSNYLENKNSPFSYKSSMPNPEIFEGYIKRKGIKGRDKKGRFITNKSLQFLIARSIFQKGIKASMFFTKPFNQAYEKLPKDLQENFVKDIENIIFDNG